MSEAASSGSEEVDSATVDTTGMTEMQKRLFNIRMKINQGRKANKTEVEEEYKRFTDPKYERKQRNELYLKKKLKDSMQATKTGEEEEEDDELDTHLNEYEEQSTAKSRKEKKKSHESIMSQTAEWAEYSQEKSRKKEENLATFGWKAFTAESTHRAYENRLGKLPKGQGSGRGKGSNGNMGGAVAEDSLEADLTNYGKSGVSKANLDMLSSFVANEQEARKKNSRRRTTFEADEVDFINDKNAQFNKKIKRAFDKYTVEIRQNLERGTAV